MGIRKILNKIQSIKILKLNDNDVIILKYPKLDSQQSMQKLETNVFEVFKRMGINNEILFIQSGLDIEIIKKENKDDIWIKTFI